MTRRQSGEAGEASVAPLSGINGLQEKEMAKCKNPELVMETSMGTIHAELWADQAPVTAKNFEAYVRDGFFDGLIFHRVIPKFMIQGGGFTPEMAQKPAKSPIRNEAKSDVRNQRGTLAMARTSVVDSATSQFFINLVDNDFLNHQNETANGFGYCVFGKVTCGMDVVDEIAGVPTGSRGGHQDVPLKPVVITSARMREDAPGAGA
jgi:cyclophilin family peptidyl-prolyl cis-trans isomerase